MCLSVMGFAGFVQLIVFNNAHEHTLLRMKVAADYKRQRVYYLMRTKAVLLSIQ